MEHDPIILSYCAGVLDADGSFAIHTRDYRASRGGEGNVYHQSRIQIKQVQREAIDLLYFTFGGRPPRITPPTAVHGKPLFYWHLSSVKAAEVCKLLLPFLRLKKRQAELLIEMQDNILATKCIKGEPRPARSPWGHIVNYRWKCLSPETLAQRRKIYDECRSLNDSRYPMGRRQ